MNKLYQNRKSKGKEHIKMITPKLTQKRKLEVNGEEEYLCTANKVKTFDVSIEDYVETINDEEEEDCDKVAGYDSFLEDTSDEDEIEVNKEEYQEKMKIEPYDEENEKSLKIEVKHVLEHIAEKPKIENKEKSEEETKKIVAESEDVSIQNKEILSRIFADLGLVEGDSLRQEVIRRLTERFDKTLVVNIKNAIINKKFLQMFPDITSYFSPRKIHKRNNIVHVEFETVAAAQNAQNRLNKDNKFKVRRLKKEDTNIDTHNCRRLALNNLPFNTSIDDVKKVFTKAKTVDFIPFEKVDRRLTRVAFLEYASVEEAISELDAHHGVLIKGNPVHVKFQQKRLTDLMTRYSFTKLLVSGVKRNQLENIKIVFQLATSIKVRSGNVIIQFANAEDRKIAQQNVSVQRVSYAMNALVCTMKEGVISEIVTVINPRTNLPSRRRVYLELKPNNKKVTKK